MWYDVLRPLLARSCMWSLYGVIAQFFDDPMLLELARQDAELGLS
jgi:hypothetical protein